MTMDTEFDTVVGGDRDVIGCDCSVVVVVDVVGCVCIIDGVAFAFTDFAGFTDFADSAGVTVIVESGVFIAGLDGVSIVGFGAVGVVSLVLLMLDANYIVDVAEIVRRLKFRKNLPE